ncbi:gamma carbonic anhydrase family protein [Desulfobacterales bacterium HSG17]|nr:gamma carbonic anhydrase family protein [Desulfobacterales bacterium HSG17]
MFLYEYQGKKPKIGKDVFIAPNATIIGDVTIGDNSSIWYNTVIRGDSASITIGEKTNIQDNCTIHIDHGKPTLIGDNVTVGHNAVVHGCTIEDNCLVGMNSTILTGAYIKKGSIIASNALVKENQEVGPRHLVAGIPAALKKEMDESIIEVIQLPADIYVEKALEFKDLKRIEE